MSLTSLDRCGDRMLGSLKRAIDLPDQAHRTTPAAEARIIGPTADDQATKSVRRPSAVIADLEANPIPDERRKALAEEAQRSRCSNPPPRPEANTIQLRKQ